MNKDTKNFLWTVLQDLRAVVRDRPNPMTVTLTFEEGGDAPLRLSNAGKAARYHAHRMVGTPTPPFESRTQCKFDRGDLTEEYLRTCIAESGRWEIEGFQMDLELDLDGETIPGHLDYLLRDKESAQLWLVDCKETNHNAFILADPNNPTHYVRGKKKGTKKPFYARLGHASQDYVFDANQWLEDPFKQDYLYQIESYRQALEEQHDIEVDECMFFVVSGNMGHMAVGLYDPLETNEAGTALFEYLREERDKNFREALDNPDPFGHNLCYEAKPGEKAPLRCSYCPFLEACFEVETVVKRGRPETTVLKIRAGAEDAPTH